MPAPKARKRNPERNASPWAVPPTEVGASSDARREATPARGATPGSGAGAAFGGVAAVVALVMCVWRLAGTCAKASSAEQRRRVENAVSHIGDTPEFQCNVECRMVDDRFNGARSYDAEPDPRCRDACVRAKKKMPNIDFGATYKRCRMSCLMAGALRSGPTRDGGASVPSASPRTASSAEDMRWLAEATACAARCTDALATGDETFDPTVP